MRYFVGVCIILASGILFASWLDGRRQQGETALVYANADKVMAEGKHLCHRLEVMDAYYSGRSDGQCFAFPTLRCLREARLNVSRFVHR